MLTQYKKNKKILTAIFSIDINNLVFIKAIYCRYKKKVLIYPFKI